MCDPTYLRICQLDSRKALVALFYTCNIILAGAVLRVGAIQGVLVTGQNCVEV